MQHEFVKMGEVGKMISEAFQKFVDKLNEKDKMLTAHKTQLRNHETKIKQMGSLLDNMQRLSDQVRDNYRKFKDLKGDSDRLQNTHSEYVTKNEINHQKIFATFDQLQSQ